MTSKRLKVGYQMDTAQIKKAAQSLKIQSVNLQSAQTDSEEFVVFSQPEKNTTVRMGRGLASFSCFELLDKEGKTIPAVNFIYQCGIGLEKFNDIKEGDILEAYIVEEYRED